jgi:signal transduction histidine kinase
MVVIGIATPIALGALAWGSNISMGDAVLLIVAAPLLLHLSLRTVDVAIPSRAGSPLSVIHWDCVEIVVIPLVLTVPAAPAAILVGTMLGLARRIGQGHYPALIHLYDGAVEGVCAFFAGLAGRAIASAGNGTSGYILAVVVGVVVFEAATLLGQTVLLTGEGRPWRDLLRAPAAVLPAVVGVAIAVTLTFREGAFVATAAIILVVLLLLELLRHFGRTSRQLEERNRERENVLELIVESAEQQRRLLAADLHDGPLQAVLSCRMVLNDRLEGRVQETEFDILTRLDEYLHGVAMELRGTVRALVPRVLTEQGVLAALEKEVEALGVGSPAVSLSYVLDQRPDPVSELLLYRVAHEALLNAVRHAGASHVQVTVSARRDEIELDVTDDGRGVSPEEVDQAFADGHVGLAIIRERVTLAGGTFTIAALAEGGTEVRAILPRPPAMQVTRASLAAKVASWWAQPSPAGPTPSRTSP